MLIICHGITPYMLVCKLTITGFKKSLFNVFLNATCHPKMAMVIDDRREVWDENDQPRVHVVRAFSPYHSPQAEVSITLGGNKSKPSKF